MSCRDEQPEALRRKGPCTRCRKRKIKCLGGRPGEACDACVATRYSPCSLLPPELQVHDDRPAANPYGDGNGFDRMIEEAQRRQQPPPATDRLSQDVQLVLFWLALTARNRRARQKQSGYR